MNTVPAPDHIDPGFAPMYVELDGLRPIPGIPDAKPIARALLKEAEAAYHVGDIATALSLVWSAGRELYGAAWVAAAGIQQLKVKTKRTGAKTKARKAFNHCFQLMPDFRHWRTPQQKAYLQEHHAADVADISDGDLMRHIREFRSDVKKASAK
jgi:hypothetical protein